MGPFIIVHLGGLCGVPHACLLGHCILNGHSTKKWWFLGAAILGIRSIGLVLG